MGEGSGDLFGWQTINLFLRATSQAGMLACTFGDCSAASNILQKGLTKEITIGDLQFCVNNILRTALKIAKESGIFLEMNAHKIYALCGQ